MGAPLKPRVRRIKKPARPHLRGEKNNFWRMWNDPETRPLMLERARLGATRNGRPPGVADGYTHQQIIVLRREAEEKADRILAAMAKHDTDISLDDLSPEELAIATDLKASAEAEHLVDDEKKTARRVLKEALVIAIAPGNMQTKLAAARTVLEYTKARPATTQNTNLNAAEAFLEALASKKE